MSKVESNMIVKFDSDAWGDIWAIYRWIGESPDRDLLIRSFLRARLDKSFCPDFPGLCPYMDQKPGEKDLVRWPSWKDFAEDYFRRMEEWHGRKFTRPSFLRERKRDGD